MNYREKLCHFLFQKSAVPYAKLFKRKRQAWGLSSSDLLEYPTNSLGYQVGLFLSTNDFEFLPKHETHDVFHVLCGYDVSVKEEIALQFLLFGNGKRSLYLYMVMFLGLVILPEHYKFYKTSLNNGKNKVRFYHKVNKHFLMEDYEKVSLDFPYGEEEEREIIVENVI